MLKQTAIVLCTSMAALVARAEPPGVSYIFPAGGQRGTKVEFRVGGFYFHGSAEFSIEGGGIHASPLVKAVETIWFDGPMILKPESQRRDDYPKDHAGDITIDRDAPLGVHRWSCRTSQGVVPSMKFIVGDLPEIVEKEMDGAPIPQNVTLPVTINGRIFPRENVDLWRFRAEKDETVTCEVASARLGYPLQAVLDVTRPDGRPVAGVRRKNVKDGDPTAWFIAPESGEYQVAIHDAGFAGGQNFVYRLTLKSGPRIESFYPLGGRRGEMVHLQFTAPGTGTKTATVSLAGAAGDSATLSVQLDGKPAALVTLHVDDLPEILEHEPNDEPAADAPAVPLPAMLNGRIDRPGDMDAWPIDLEKGAAVALEIIAEKLGSRLDSVLTVCDTDGKELAKNDDRADGRADSRLVFTAQKSGRYLVKVSDRFAGRGGPDFAYRLRATPASSADFELTLNSDAINVIRSTEDPADAADPKAKKKPGPKVPGLRVDLVSAAPLTKDLKLEVEGLPAGVTVENNVITAKQKFADLRFVAPPKTPIQATRVTIRGTTEIDGKPATQQASVPVPFGDPKIDQVRLAVVPPVPFKHVGEYLVVNDHPGGTTMTKHYEIERGGFDGPLTVSLSDRQIRTLQGVTAAPLAVKSGAAGFDFTVQYPAEVELGHTSRIQLMLVGEMTDFDGSRHLISYTTGENDEQMISVGASGLLRISTPLSSLRAVPGTQVNVPIAIQRGPSVGKGSVRIELVVPKHIAGVTAQPVEIPAGEDKGAIAIRFGSSPGPFNMPVTFEARATGPAGESYLGETKIEIVAEAKK